MERNPKECYESPATQVIELVQEGVICDMSMSRRGGYTPDDENPFNNQTNP